MPREVNLYCSICSLEITGGNYTYRDGYPLHDSNKGCFDQILSEMERLRRIMTRILHDDNDPRK